jgi:RHS repeat-associated protein
VSSSSTSGGATAATSYGYDANGNMTTRITPATGTQTIAYDEHQLIKSVTSPSNSVSYVHDADGNQLLRRNADSTTLFLPGQEIARSSSGTVSVTRYYTHGGVVVAERVNRGNPIYLMSDLHGTNEIAYRPDTGKVTRRYLDPYGNPLGAVSGGPWPDTHTFLDKPNDASTGLTDVGAREYDSTLGRFISVDPVLEADSPGQLNGYSYGSNNPIGNADPTGLMHPKEEEPHGPPTPTPHKRTPTPTPSSGPGHHVDPCKGHRDCEDANNDSYPTHHHSTPSSSGPHHHLDPCKGHRDCEDANNDSYPRRHVAPPLRIKPVVLPPLVMEEPLCSGGSWRSLVECGRGIFDGVEGAAKGVEAADGKGKHAGEGSASRIGGKAALRGRLLSVAEWGLTYDEEREEGAGKAGAMFTATTTTLGGLAGSAMVGTAGAGLGMAIPFPIVDVGAAAVLGGVGSVVGGMAGSDLGRAAGHGIVHWATQTTPADYELIYAGGL